MSHSSLVFIDARVSGYRSLIDQLPPSAEVFVLDSESDGLEQMAAHLAGRSGIEAIHVVSHGSQGALYLGNARVDGSNLASHGSLLGSIGSSLSDAGDILLYGCDVASGDAGLQFIQSLAQFTGADVAASSNLTGPVAFGGDAVLEQSSGSVQVTALTLDGLSGVLGANTAPTFAVGDGKVTTDFGSLNDIGYSIALQADGKILLAGYSGDSSYDFALARYNVDGSLDTSFNGDGMITQSIGPSSYDYGQSVALQADGKILVAGHSTNSNGYADFALVRYNLDGSLDTSFSGDGMLTTDFGSSSDTGRGMALQVDGKILIAGESDSDFALARYNADGSLDTSFSGDGKLTTDFVSSNDRGQSVVLQTDGKIMLAGSSYSDSSYDFALVRYNADGSLDTSFSGDGKLTTDFESSLDMGSSVALQPDGKILVAGLSPNTNGNYVFALARYSADGILDASFSGDGKLTTDFGSSYADGQSVLLQADYKILVAGSSSSDFALARYNADGSLDTNFSGDGMLTTAIGSSYDAGYSVTVQADGRILIAGYGYNNGDADFALVRYNPDGSLDQGFGLAGSTLDATPTYTGSAPVALDTNVQIYDSQLVLSNNYYGSTVTLARHGGADASDVFSAVTGGSLSALTTGGYFSINGTSVGRVLSNANGTLKLGFIEGATQELVNQTLQQIAYANTASTPPARVQIDWNFSDGNTGSQGTGGAMAVTGSTTVHITAGNVAPTVGSGLQDLRVLPSQAFEYTIPVGTFSDANAGEPFSYTLTMADNTALPPWLQFNGTTGTFSGTPGVFDEGRVELRVTATDTAGIAVPDLFLLQVDSNAAPTGTLAVTGNPAQGQVLTVNDTLADAEGLGTISYQWLANGQIISGATGNNLVLAQAQVGKTISVNASYTDGQGRAESVTSTATTAVANVNDAPTGGVTISGMATQGQILAASNTLVDVDGLGSISYQWKASGKVISGATGSTYQLTQAEVGKTISVTANYTDGQGTAESKTSGNTAVVANVNDTPTGTVTISGTAALGRSLTAAVDTLADVDGLGAISYQWLADGQAIVGATENTLWLEQEQVGQTISVTVSYTDDQGSAESVTSTATTAVIRINDAPTGSVMISGVAAQGQTLTAANTLADVNGLGVISYQWQADGQTIAGATENTLKLEQEQVGQSIRVIASYIDAQGGAESVTSAATAAVANVNDAPTGSVMISGPVTQGQILRASNTLADVDGLGIIAYQWKANDTAISGATAATYRLTQAQVGKSITVIASYTDDQGSAESVTSATTTAVLNVNDVPTGTVTISGTATQGQTLTARNTLVDVDGLGSISYQWRVNGNAINGAISSSYSLGQADVGQTLSVTASYTDLQGTAESKTSAATNTVANVNDAPTGSVSIGGTATQGQTLTAANTLADADGLGTISYQWLRGGNAISGATTKTYALTASDVGNAISVRASYTDGQGTAESQTSTTVTPIAVFEPGLVFGEVAGLITTEAGGTDSFTVALRAAPRYDVKLTFTISDATEAVFAASGKATHSVSFTAANWAKAQTVVLRGVDDKPEDGDLAYTISTRVSSSDLRYDGMRSGSGLSIANLIAQTTDDDTPDYVYGDSGGTRIGDDLIQGGNGASDLYGLLGRDEIHGNNGDDRLYGGYGDDVLYGNADDDELEGDQGNDKLDGGTGNDGLNGGTGNDSLYGQAGNDNLLGEAGKDSLVGGAGNDTLNGGADADNMDGGNGADVYYIDNAADVVRDSGTDTVVDTVYIMAYLSGGITLGAGIDNGALNELAGKGSLTGNTGSNTLTGNASDNTLNGGAGVDSLTGGAGADNLSGGTGNDTLYSGDGNDVVDAGDGADLIIGGDGAGNDKYNGGAGIDTVKYTSATAAIMVNLTTGGASGTNIGKDTLSNIEYLIGGKGSDSLTGSAVANKMDGDTGNDAIKGEAGHDTLIGGTGNDTLAGGAGKDGLTGGAGNDVFDFNALGELGLGATVRDVITDFTVGQDKIDLVTIDANTALAGDQAFKFVTSFTATAGQVRYSKGIVYLNTDSDTAAEYEIGLTGIVPASLTAASFVL